MSDEEIPQFDNFTNDSAMMIAFERHLESRHDGAFFTDPFAKSLAGSKGERLSEEFGTNYSVVFGFAGWPEFHKNWTAVRTKFIDDHISEFAATGKYHYILNLGAGMDTRPYRLECYKNFKNGNFDFDMAVVNKNKQVVFEKFLSSPQAHCGTRDIDLDFLSEDKTIATELDAFAVTLNTGYADAGQTKQGPSQSCAFDKSKPSVIISEGLIMYLGKIGKQKLIKDVSAVAAAGSALVLQFMDASESEASKAHPGALDNALSRAEALELLTAGGWDTDTIQFYRFGEEKLNFGRFPLDKFKPTASFSFCVCFKK